MTLLTQPQRQLVNLALIRAHLVASAVAFAVVLLGGLTFALQFMQQYPCPGIPLLSPGRVRMVHTNMAAYGFIVNAFVAGMLWAIPRLTKRPILRRPRHHAAPRRPVRPLDLLRLRQRAVGRDHGVGAGLFDPLALGASHNLPLNKETS